MHEIQLAAEKDSLRRTSLLLRIGELQRTKLLDAEKAFDAYARAFREDPSTEAAKEQLEALAPLIEDGWARLVKLFEERARQAKDLDPKLAHELATKVARSYEDRLGNSAKAVEFFKKALAIETDDLGALAALEAIFTRDEKYPELLEIYRRRIEIANEPDERLDARSSPLSEWKLFVRGLAAFYRHEREEALANWDRLDRERAPSAIAERLKGLDQQAIAGPGGGSSFEALEGLVFGERILPSSRS